MLVIGRQDRMWALLFDLRAHHRLYVLWSVHIVIGCWHKIGPMGLNIAQMQAPRRIASPIHKLHCAADGLGGFAVLFSHPGGPVGMGHQPARKQLSIIPFGRVCPLLPRIGALKTQFFKV